MQYWSEEFEGLPVMVTWGRVCNGKKRKVGIYVQKLWMTAEQVPCAFQPGMEEKPSSVRQQQLEEKENRQNKMEPAPLRFLKEWPVARHERIRRRVKWIMTAIYRDCKKKWRPKGKGKKSLFCHKNKWGRKTVKNLTSGFLAVLNVLMEFSLRYVHVSVTTLQCSCLWVSEGKKTKKCGARQI